MRRGLSDRIDAPWAGVALAVHPKPCPPFIGLKPWLAWATDRHFSVACRNAPSVAEAIGEEARRGVRGRNIPRKDPAILAVKLLAGEHAPTLDGFDAVVVVHGGIGSHVDPSTAPPNAISLSLHPINRSRGGARTATVVASVSIATPLAAGKLGDGLRPRTDGRLIEAPRRC